MAESILGCANRTWFFGGAMPKVSASGSKSWSICLSRMAVGTTSSSGLNPVVTVW
ncbi:hypothetical protein D3C73_1548690 [compost metagenome]